MKVRQRLLEAGLERNLRPSTMTSYHRLLKRIGVLDLEVPEVTREWALEAVWRLENPNTRRSTIIALRAVLGLDIRIPRGVPRQHRLPDEDTLRMTLMLSPHEIRGLLAMYAGLRSGEACAITGADVQGDRLVVDKQVLEETNLIGPVKSIEGVVTIPWWLSERLAGVTGTARPASVRESLRRAGQKTGISLSPVLLRKWYITRLITAGVPLELVRQQARHSSLTTTLAHYQEYNSQQIHDVLG